MRGRAWVIAIVLLTARRAEADVCPAPSEILERARSQAVPLAGRRNDGQASAGARAIDATVELEREGASWMARITLKGPGEATITREVHGDTDSCDSVADAATLIVALAMKPPDGVPSAEIEPAPATLRGAAPSEATSVHLRVFAGAAFAMGLTPEPTAGARVGLGMASDRFANLGLELSAIGLLPRATRDDGFRVGALAGAADLCWTGASGIALKMCAGPVVGAFLTESRANGLLTDDGALLGGAEARLGARMAWGRTDVTLELGLLLSASQPTFRPDVCGPDAFQPAPISGIISASFGETLF